MKSVMRVVFCEHMSLIGWTRLTQAPLQQQTRVWSHEIILLQQSLQVRCIGSWVSAVQANTWTLLVAMAC